MNWSWKLGHIAGIDIYLHPTFLIVPAYVWLTTLAAGGGVAAAVAAIAVVLAIFGCVLLHELGHALMARHYGIVTRDITLLPIGGLARLERMPEQPGQELAIVLAGPVVNVVIAASLAVGLVLGGGDLWSAMPNADSFIGTLLAANVALVVFNLLPAFPMDGGRVLRAALAMRMPYVRATRIAANIGRGLAVVMGVAGLFGNWTFGAHRAVHLLRRQQRIAACGEDDVRRCGRRGRPSCAERQRTRRGPGLLAVQSDLARAAPHVGHPHVPRPVAIRWPNSPEFGRHMAIAEFVRE